MANIQLEHGYTRIADALLEALCRASMPQRNHRVFIALIRLTYGFGKRSDRIATSQISKLTGIDRRSVTRVLADLEVTGMIERGPLERGRSRRLGVVKDFEQWEVIPASEVSADPAIPTSSGVTADPTRGDPPTGVAATPVGSPETPLVGSPAPPSIERERLTRESGASAPAPTQSFGPRPIKIKTRCPKTLDPEDRAAVVAWCAEKHPGEFANRELAKQWERFEQWHYGQQESDADWPGRFQSWLTSDKYHPLANDDARSAAIQVYQSSEEAPPESTAEEWAQALEECRQIRERSRLRPRKAGTITTIEHVAAL